MDKKLIDGFADRFVAAIKGHLTRQAAALGEQVQALQQRIEALPVPKDGDPGKPGIAGADGTSVDVETVRAMAAELVAQAVAEMPAPDPGRPGEDGLPGIDGRDAADIVILSEIDESKVYAKGTFACYRGGLIRATRKTSPIADDLSAAGWQVVMNGIAEESAVILPGGQIERTTLYTSGASSVCEVKLGAEFDNAVRDYMAEWSAGADEMAASRIAQAVASIPRPRDGTDGAPGGTIEDFDVALSGRVLTVAMKIGGEVVQKDLRLDIPLYRDVYQSGKQYEKDDQVTFGGSMFIALRDTSQKPEASKDWKLIVKRGRDGKDKAIEI